MKKLLSALTLAAVMLTSLTACQKENKPLESNWKFEQLQTKDKTTKADEFSEEDTPILQIIKDNLNEGEYFITYRQSGKNHAGIISKENDTYSIMFNDTEEEMQINVSGDKLTLTTTNNKDNKITFSYTDDQILIPVDDILAPHYIKAKMTGNCKVDITNEGDADYMYGKYSRLEVQKNGKWYYAREKQPYAWTDIGILLPPKETNTEEYNLEHYGTLEAGEYRLAVGDIDAAVYAEFTVNADGSFSYPE